MEQHGGFGISGNLPGAGGAARGSCPGRDTGAAGLLSCLEGAEHDGSTAGPAGALLLLPGLILIHRLGTLSWTSKEFASKRNKHPPSTFLSLPLQFLLPTRFRAEKRFSVMLPGLEFQFPMDAAPRSTAQIVPWPLGVTPAVKAPPPASTLSWCQPAESQQLCDFGQLGDSRGTSGAGRAPLPAASPGWAVAP